MSIFHAYDIRGIYPNEINGEIVYKIGRAYSHFLRNTANKEKLKIGIGRDVRASSDLLAESLIKGLSDSGVDVFDIGVCTTPQMYFACGSYGYDGSIMITASHNPKEYNGLKLTREQAIPINGDTGIKDIEALVEKNDFGSVQGGSITRQDAKADYKEKLLNYANEIKKLKVVIDTANSVGVMETEVLKEIVNVVPLYFELDSSFPNHEANPLKVETLKVLQEKVVEEKADLGIAFDGDADRVGFVDEKGRIITSDFVTALIGSNILAANPNQRILYDLRSSKVVKEEIESLGGKAIMCRVGHAFIKQQMRDEDAVFAGELSGHYYFKDLYYAESSLLAALQLLSLMSKKNKPISELVEPLQKYFHSGEINFEVSDKERALSSLEKNFTQAKNIFKLDGLSMEFGDWWFNVRPSNTEPLLRLNIEADTNELMEEKKKEVIGIINS